MSPLRPFWYDPKWIAVFLTLATIAGGAVTWGFNAWQFHTDVQTHLEQSATLPEWRAKVDRQIELLTYLACRNEEAHHPDAPPLECDRMKRTHYTAP